MSSAINVRECPYCAAPMEPGVTLATAPPGTPQPPTLLFAATSPQAPPNEPRTFARAGARHYRIDGWRCTRCGMLQLTATDPVA